MATKVQPITIDRKNFFKGSKNHKPYASPRPTESFSLKFAPRALFSPYTFSLFAFTSSFCFNFPLSVPLLFFFFLIFPFCSSLFHTPVPPPAHNYIGRETYFPVHFFSYFFSLTELYSSQMSSPTGWRYTRRRWRSSRLRSTSSST
jgi:hypothetical protein